jgi:hypothetical protein
MSTPEKDDPARGWLFIEKLRLDDEVQRLEGMSDDEVRAELGIEAAQIPSAEKLMAKAHERETRARTKADGASSQGPAVASLESTRRARLVPPVVWLLAAAAVLLAILVTKKDQIVALFQGPPKPVLPQPAPSPPPPSPQELAAGPRGDAQKACAAGEWAACADKLDEAKKLDPASEGLPAVLQMRELIRNGLLEDLELEAKPKRPTH